ncbi:MAG: uroporphyrinogen decarboxylase family protein [Spirochaetales bacterium]|nr:uroporphyrinogen decarboxylase family protein [Spirochaetales bacterium]
MTIRENINAILHYESYRSLPLVHFGFWEETLTKWADQGHISRDQAQNWQDGNGADFEISALLGFDTDWCRLFGPDYRAYPAFERRVLEEDDQGNMKVLNCDGVIVMEKRDVVSIPTEVDHYLKGRKEWDEEFKVRFQYSPERYTDKMVPFNESMLTLEGGGLDFMREDEGRELPLGLNGGSMIGIIRDTLGVENMSYMTVDDPDLLKEIIDTSGEMSYQVIKTILETGARFDFLHFWEDICFKNGPLMNPVLFAELVAPHYKRITALAAEHSIDIISVDCDGLIDSLIPHWLENGVNTMFPIEVGTWKASIAPWREQYGQELRGVGGMDKTVFARDRRAVEAEVERLKPLVDLGGYIPCPDHRIAPDAQWDNVRLYCDLMRKAFA